MGILVVANDLNKPSHLWMRRQLRGLGSAVVAVAAVGQMNSEDRELHRRYIQLRDQAPLWRRIATRLTLTSADDGGMGANKRKLARAFRSPEVAAVLMHYVNRAVRYRDVIESIAKPVFVHCHGYDVTWDLRVPEGSRFGCHFHPSNYIDAVRELPENLKFIANSRHTMERLEDIGVSKERIVVKHLGVEIPEHPRPSHRRTRSVEILFLGRLVDFKGPDLVIRAFERASERGLDGRLTLAGDGPLRLTCELLRSRSPYQGRISLVGSVDEEQAARLRAEADIFTAHNCIGPVTHQEEAFGVAVVEAMAAGLPVVSGDNGSLPEIITDGAEGFLIQPGDIDAHADALLRLATDPELRTQMGTAGWARARDHFSLESEIRLLRQFFGL